jgi:hypothetical protein
MLFPYTYVPHQMEKMQTYIDFIFYEVWSKAPTSDYGIHLYEPCEELCKIMEELHRRDLAGDLQEGAGKYFYESVNSIFNAFKKLTDAEIDLYKQAFDSNNKVEELCSGSLAHVPMVYAGLNNDKEELNGGIEKFFKNLYSSGFFNLVFVKEVVGSDLTQYYKEFVRKNNTGTCPFCGLLPIDGEYDPTREAFDHYLPKSKYPFNSVNLKNLAPSCGKCNSGNKRDQDPLSDSNTRRKAFYPYAAAKAEIAFSITVNDKYWPELIPEGIEINIQSDGHSEELETWAELFKIEKRYAAKCCGNNGGRNWLNRVLAEYQNYNLSVPAMLNAELKSAEASPWFDANFLKKAFLEGCKHAGLFNIKLKAQTDHDDS